MVIIIQNFKRYQLKYIYRYLTVVLGGTVVLA